MVLTVDELADVAVTLTRPEALPEIVAWNGVEVAPAAIVTVLGIESNEPAGMLDTATLTGPSFAPLVVIV